MAACVFSAVSAGCARGERPAATPEPQAAAASGAASVALQDTRSEEPRVVLCLGTSLTAGFGLDPSQAWPALIQQKVDAASLAFRVVNGGISGETSAALLRRLEWVLNEPVAVLVIETGANDALRGHDIDATRANIAAILNRASEKAPAPTLVLAAMEAPPNYGRDYTTRFRALFPDLARSHNATLLPFLLEGVAGVASLNQPDGVHPTAEGQRVVATNVWKVIEPLLRASAR